MTLAYGLIVKRYSFCWRIRDLGIDWHNDANALKGAEIRRDTTNPIAQNAAT